MTPIEALDDAMRHQYPVLIETQDGHAYLCKVLNIAAGKAWLVVGDRDKFVPLHLIETVQTFSSQIQGF